MAQSEPSTQNRQALAEAKAFVGEARDALRRVRRDCHGLQTKMDENAGRCDHPNIRSALNQVHHALDDIEAYIESLEREFLGLRNGTGTEGDAA